MSLTIFIGKYYVHDIDNYRNKTCYVEINHGKQVVRTSSLFFNNNNDSNNNDSNNNNGNNINVHNIKKKEGYIVNFSQFVELLVLLLSSSLSSLPLPSSSSLSSSSLPSSSSSLGS